MWPEEGLKKRTVRLASCQAAYALMPSHPTAMLVPIREKSDGPLFSDGISLGELVLKTDGSAPVIDSKHCPAIWTVS